MASWKKRKNGSRLQNNFRKSPCFAEWKLQWGRGRMAPENNDGIYITKNYMAASMGPGPDGPGKRPFFFALSGFLPGFNGAGAGWPRKTAGTVPCIEAHSEASMGPGPDGPGKHRLPAAITHTQPCFNGAGAGWPRKTARSSTGQGRWLAGQVARGVATPAGGTPQTYSTNIQFQRLFHFQRT